MIFNLPLTFALSHESFAKYNSKHIYFFKLFHKKPDECVRIVRAFIRLVSY